MNALRRRALIVGACMGATAAGAARLGRGDAATSSPLALDRAVPSSFGAWRVDPVATAFIRAADRQGRSTRLYDQVFERTFVNVEGERVMLSIAHVSDASSDLQLHRPEVCYRAGGFAVRDIRSDRLRLGPDWLPVTRLVAALPGRPEPVTYWTAVAGEVAAAEPVPWYELLRTRSWRRTSDSVLVRISSIDEVPDAAFRRHGDFAQALVLALAPELRSRIAGRPEPNRASRPL